MTAVRPQTNVEVEELTVEQSHTMFDRHARRLVGMSGAEFLQAWGVGEIQESPSRPEVSELVMYLPFAYA